MIEYTVQTVKTDNFEMDYLKFGTGARPLVLLPGMSLKSTMGIASMVADSYKIFADDFTVYLFDRKKNFGESYLMEEMAADTAEAMDVLGIGANMVKSLRYWLQATGLTVEPEFFFFIA